MVKMKRSRLFLLVILLVYLVACSSEDEVKKEKKADYNTEKGVGSEVNLNIKKAYSWVNLMPGPRAKPRFHVSGELEILQSADYNFNEIKLYEVNVLQDDELLYTIQPEIRVADNLSTGKSKYILFSTPRGLDLKDELKREQPIDVRLMFSTGEKSLTAVIEELTIEEAH